MTLDYATNPGDVDLDITSGYGLFGVPGASQNQQNVITGGLNNCDPAAAIRCRRVSPISATCPIRRFSTH